QAWNVDTGEKVWTHPYPTSPTWGSMLATAGGLVFTGGTNDRKIHAFDAATGKLLWEFVTTSGIVAPPTTFSISGKQYLALHTGWGGGTRGKEQRAHLRPFLDYGQSCRRQMRSPSIRERPRTEVAVPVQERERDLRPDVRVDHFQQELTIGPQDSSDLGQCARNPLPIEMVDRRHAHHAVERAIRERHRAHVTDFDLEPSVGTGRFRIRSQTIGRVVRDPVVAGEAVQRDDLRVRT